jgi:hypothetical protein
MPRRPLVAAAVSVTVWVLACPVSYVGAQTGACSTPGQSLVCIGTGGGGGDLVVTEGPFFRIEATLQRLDDVAVAYGNPGDPAACDITTSQLTPTGVGTLYFMEVISLADGSTLSSGFRCIAPGEDPVPPDPPTREEVFDSAPIPDPAIHVSPIGDGLVGLDTWLWGDPHGTVAVSVTLRGWTVSGQVSPVSWVFETSNGGHYAADNPGSEANPVGRHVFSRSGTYTISHTVEWGGSFSVSGYGLTFAVGDLGGAFASTLGYDVIEIEAVIDSN